MRIGVDIDEVLAECIRELARFHNDTYSTNIKYEDFHSNEFWKVWGGTRDESIEKCVRFHKSHYADRMKPVDGSIEGIRSLRSEGFKLHAITARDMEFKKGTVEWVEKYFPKMFSTIDFTGHYSTTGKEREKVEYCKEYGAKIMIDDNIHHATKCAEGGLDVILFNKPWNIDKEVPMNVYRVDDWLEATRRIKSLSVN